MPGRIIIFFLSVSMTACQLADHKKQRVLENQPVDTLTIHKEPVAPQTRPQKGQYSLIKKLCKEGDSIFIEADYIQFLMGDNAVAAARQKNDADTFKDKNGRLVYSVLDDYYILNDNAAIRKLPVIKNVLIELVNTEDGQTFISSAGFDQLTERIKDGIFILQIEEGKVTKIRQQFLP
jgi:hypothetical protein